MYHGSHERKTKKLPEAQTGEVRKVLRELAIGIAVEVIVRIIDWLIQKLST